MHLACTLSAGAWRENLLSRENLLVNRAIKWDVSHRMVKARQVDGKRRVTLPEDFEPGSDVLMEQVDPDTWLIRRYRPQRRVKILKIPVIRRLPDDPEWDKVERAFASAAKITLSRPEED
jgi:hypothetical protein